ncbi:MAG: hypothetical protein ACK5L6_03790 [Anaerorhabdus sp.]|uniref:hypothetical protein n=1 Tax=Anaerorhabdus sp. TaxID=1872524 RepID=UPI003A85EADF
MKYICERISNLDEFNDLIDETISIVKANIEYFEDSSSKNKIIENLDALKKFEFNIEHKTIE